MVSAMLIRVNLFSLLSLKYCIIPLQEFCGACLALLRRHGAHYRCSHYRPSNINNSKVKNVFVTVTISLWVRVRCHICRSILPVARFYLW